MKNDNDDIIIIKKGKDIYGNTVILYVCRDQPDLKRIKIKSDDQV